jgi:ComF family protein
LWIISDYDEKIKKIISGIKYNFIEELAEYWDKLIEDYFKLKQDWPKEAILIPVPLHAKRLLERGFNQSELICEALARVYGNEIKTGIVWRAVNSKPQAKLKSAERKGNVRGIFKVNKGIKIDKLRGKKIVLIDDVYTTGATMEECAKTLKEAGIKEIWGLALARGA